MLQEGEIVFDTDQGVFYGGDGITSGGFPIGASGDSSAQTIICRNNTATTIPKFNVVYIDGGLGNEPTIQKALATTDMTSAKTFGVTKQEIPNNTSGEVVHSGELDNLNTSAFTPGDFLWLSSTVAGGVTNVRPTQPNHAVFVGYVIRSHPTLGKIVIQIINGFEIEELHDVLVTSIQNNQVLAYESASSLWKNKTLTKADVGLGNVDNTSDANKPISSATQTALNAKQNTITGAATTVTSSNLALSRAVVSDASGKIAASSVTSTEVGHLSGVTSAIQTQLNGKQPTITGAITGVVNSDLAGDVVVITDSAGKIESGSTTVDQLNTLYDINTSTTIQAQLDAKPGKRFFRHYPMLLQWFNTFFSITPSNGLNRHAAANIGYYCKRKAYIYSAESMTIYAEIPPQPNYSAWESLVTSELSSVIGGTTQNCHVVFEDEIDPSIVVPSRVSWYNKGLIEILALPFAYGYEGGFGSFGFLASVWNSWKGLAMPPKANQVNPSAPAVIQSIWDQLGGGNSADFITNELSQAVWKRAWPYSKGRKLLWLPKVGLWKTCGTARDRMAIDTGGNLVNWSTDQFQVLANGWFDTGGNMHMRPAPMYPNSRLVFVCLMENSAGERALEISGPRADQINVAHFDQNNYEIEMVVEQPNGYVKVYQMPHVPFSDNNIYQVRIDLTYAGVNTPYRYPPGTRFYFRLKSKTSNRVSEMFPMCGEVRKALRWDIVQWSSFVQK